MVATNVVRSLWAEPRAPGAPARVWRDWALVVVVIVAAVIEGVVRPDVAWRPVVVAMSIGLAFTLLWRRTHPLAVVAIAFGSATVITLAALLAGVTTAVGLNTTAFVVLLLYSLLRWGSGREVGIGLGFVAVAAALGIAADFTGIADAIGAIIFLILPVMLGALIRYGTMSRQRELADVKLREREQLARELHDTVAHHVSAIAIRAQAGRVVAASDPQAAVDALDVIEEEASRTLDEMRTMVGGLRGGLTADLAPQPGMSDLTSLARDSRVTVDLDGTLDDLRPSVATAIYRISQESVTNAVRHARHATRIDVRVRGDRHSVELTVEDNGDSIHAERVPTGYGLVGMAERATLLGGSFEAGPGRDRGWTVQATLPKAGPTR